MIPFTITPESITLIQGGRPQVFQKGTAQYEAIKKAVLTGDWDAVEKSTTKGGAAATWLAKSGDDLAKDFAVDGDRLTFKGEPMPEHFQARATAIAAEGKSPLPLLRFFKRLTTNPSKRSVDGLYQFLQHLNIPIEEDGTFLAYKGVTNGLKDVHSGSIDNTPGKVIVMERNKISDDPREACHEGLHVGASSYALSFGPRAVVCRVKPENVVCVPYDSSAMKMRVCEYEVVAHYTGLMPSTTVEEGEVITQEAPEETVEEVATPTPKKGRSKPAPTARLAKLDSRGLLGETIDSLRAYAIKLKIAGATRLPGGKIRLVKEIVKARRK